MIEDKESPEVTIEIDSDEGHEKKGKMVGSLLMQLLLKQMPPDVVKQQIMAMIQGKPEEVQKQIMDKIDYLLQMQTAGGEMQAMNDPMVNGQMPEGFDQRNSDSSVNTSVLNY